MRLPLRTTWIPPLSSSHSHFLSFQLGTSPPWMHILIRPIYPIYRSGYTLQAVDIGNITNIYATTSTFSIGATSSSSQSISGTSTLVWVWFFFSGQLPLLTVSSVQPGALWLNRALWLFAQPPPPLRPPTQTREQAQQRTSKLLLLHLRQPLLPLPHA